MSLAYLLDTNVVSEALKSRPNEGVLRRMEAEDGRMAIPSVVWHELLYGMMRLPESRRRTLVEDFLVEFVEPVFPVLSYDDSAGAWHADQRTILTAAGRSTSFPDAQIAAVAATRNLVLVTRNRKDFEDFEGLHVECWHS